MIDNLGFALDGTWKVLTIGLLFGAGLPVVFALGIRALAWGTDDPGGTGSATAARANPLGRPLAMLCFALILIAIALGITVIVATGFGRTVSFEHVYPTITSAG